MISFLSRNILCFMVFFLGCDQGFNPFTDQGSATIVYCILSTDRSTQFVRVFSTYPRAIENPYQNERPYPIDGSSVSISDGFLTFPFSDTTLIRPDTSRYAQPIHAYYSEDFTVSYGQEFTLHVQLPTSETLFASLRVPYSPYLNITGEDILSHPGDYPITEKIKVFASFGSNTKAYILRLVVCFDVLLQGKWVRMRREIPVGFLDDPPTLAKALYSKVTKINAPFFSVKYSNEVYGLLLNDIATRYASASVVFNYAVLQAVQLDENLYNSFVTVNGFDDPTSLRLDLPNFSNIVNGSGLFAAYTVDSLVTILPTSFPFNH